ncbi:MAG: ParB/RepB/Spo0J family partition protein [Paracoccaceae bacterium]|nr:ParB/RepB/Spo0J family partition protein [Paracoccaceae bacterium]
MAKPERRGLGRGLSALMADVESEAPANDASPSARKAETTIDIALISPNPDQPRRHFSDDALSELANSIREKGIIQPLILRQNPRDASAYEIVAGERRWRAAQRAQLHEVPAIIRELDDVEVLELALIENIQRDDLNAIEEAQAYRQLMDRFGHTQEKLAEALGKSRSHIANLLRLLNLPQPVLNMVVEGTLSAGHARAILTSDDPLSLARLIAKKGMSVRDAEKLAKGGDAKPASPSPAPKKDADTQMLEKDLKAALGMAVSIDHPAGSESGSLTIRYKSLEQLDEVCRRLSAVDGGKV